MQIFIGYGEYDKCLDAAGQEGVMIVVEFSSGDDENDHHETSIINFPLPPDLVPPPHI